MCEVRGGVARGLPQSLSDVELWIQEGSDCQNKALGPFVITEEDALQLWGKLSCDFNIKTAL